MSAHHQHPLDNCLSKSAALLVVALGVIGVAWTGFVWLRHVIDREC